MPSSDRPAGQPPVTIEALTLAMVERIGGIGSWTLALPGQQLHPSSECAAILGLPPGTPLTLQALAARFTPEWCERIALLLHACRQDGQPFDVEMQLAAPGAPAASGPWVRAVGQAVRHDSGQIIALQGALQDISARKQAQSETLRLAMRLTTTLASITEAFVTLDRQCCFTYLNQESERLLQRPASELLGREVWQDVINGVGQRLKHQLQNALATNRRTEFEDFYPSLGLWLEVRAYPFAEGLAVYFRDVTQRRKSQEHLMLLETCIARLNDIVLIAEISPARPSVPCIVFVNQAFEHHTGYTRQEVLGQTPGQLLGPEATPGELERMAAALQHKRQVHRELRIYRKDASSFWLELEVVRVLAPAGELTHWVAVGRDITQRKAAADAFHNLAFYDPLTNLPNRLLLLKRLGNLLAQSAQSRRQGALMFIDVDKLKVLNDTLGHHKGDLLLQQVAERLSNCVRKSDTVARLGGDEFVVMLKDLGDDPAAAALRARSLAEKVLNELREPFDLGGHQHYTTSSIGLTSLNGQHDSVSDVLKQADLAMYQAKTSGRNTVCFFDPDMQEAVSANAAVSTELHVALREHQFELHYQPQVNRQGRVIGVEALLRWQHPVRGLLGPEAFIPMAEETGLILPLGQWALKTACEQLAAWSRWPVASSLSISVNVSVRQFRHPEFVDRVMAEIERSGIRPQRLKLELTESLLADGMEITLAKMGILKALGVTLALDDFGMGYSSLSLLKRLPLDQLKIDRSFVSDVLSDRNDAAISRAIITLAHSLNLEVVAEGVQTQAQRDFLTTEGCDHFQGYLFSEPLTVQALEAYLMAQAAHRRH
ncbi:MAG: EAL domain-containing protein [Pseudomonadota bacterium]|nr:EAL domain-containing protein [Pseudomonadota bacterium]